jgi:mono/diheme cytochrome c family protein
MSKSSRTLSLFALIGGLTTSIAAAQEPGGDLAEQAYRIRERYCYKCHISDAGAPRFDVLDAAKLIGRDGGAVYVVPGSPAESSLWQRMGIDQDMPPLEEAERPTAEELAIIQSWIEQGAPDFKPGSQRGFISEGEILTSILNDLQQNVARNDRRRQRYFSLVHLYNNQSVNDDKLRLYRAAFSIAVNSLSRKSSRIIVPVSINESQTIFRVDLREVGWDNPERWLQVLQAYPYGMKWRDRELAELQKDIEDTQKSNSAIPVKYAYLKADWFVAKATRPPLYHTLLGLPDTLEKLDQELGIDMESDFLAERMKRAGFTGSGPSRHNRAVDWMEGTNTRYYYRSYDFGGSAAKQVLFRFPLGPKFEKNPFGANPNLAFEEDGGEFVFSLPNGLNGYYISDVAGNRLDVRDLSEIAGTPEVVNGISCIGCHRKGIQPYKDMIRDAQVVTGSADADAKIEELYVEEPEMTAQIQADTAHFVAAWERCVRPYRRPDASVSEANDIIDVNEPVTAIAKFYDGEVGLEELARELGMARPDDIGAAIRTNRELQSLGLGALARGGKITREMLDATEEASFSVYQEAADKLGLGTPDKVSQ